MMPANWLSGREGLNDNRDINVKAFFDAEVKNTLNRRQERRLESRRRSNVPFHEDWYRTLLGNA